MTEKRNFLGIDIGSISISIAVIDQNGNLLQSSYRFHHGQIKASLTRMLFDLCMDEFTKIGLTSASPQLIQDAIKIDNRVAFIAAAKAHFPSMGSLLIVGGENFGIAQFENDGTYLNFKSNSSCAAGTGSFLDQQAKRLNLSGITEFSQQALKNKNDIPKIASRCAVFAKTDLIHAQQEGHTLSAICDGLSYGLAKNIVDTLFTARPPNFPMVLVGGVSKNQAVIRHLSNLLEQQLLVHENSHIFGAIGAALECKTKHQVDNTIAIQNNLPLVFINDQKNKSYDHDPLTLNLSSYPIFSSLKRYEFQSDYHKEFPLVEIDLYKDGVSFAAAEVFLGIDIGSTSTKAVLLDNNKNVLVGLYTRTSGRPVEAAQTILEAIVDLESKLKHKFQFRGAGTTGSGRKFIGEIIAADIALDEITAHARAAVELDPDVDTIIEIGGQDSKFTTLKNGMVTFSVMNNVCAAGTGSFVEEQAKKLDCPLEDYSARAENVAAPLSSDKCTVFMERDLNYYLTNGYSVDEVLASVLHSVRDNYLTKVAIESNIGNRIFFQGATAKNKALVAAFEQKLQKPIMVSKFCHLTGALGVALHLYDQQNEISSFRGIELYKQKIPVESEICEHCSNHCKIKTAIVDEQKVAFGFLCGRDYDTHKYVNDNRSGFDLLKTRKRILQFKPATEFNESFIIGLPVALHLFDEIDFWQYFFAQCSIQTITSENLKQAVKKGKKLTGAEFCAPIAAFHAHTQELAQKADYVFLPDYLETKDQTSESRRQYCYYTQYAPALISHIESITDQTKILNPTLKTIRGAFHSKVQLYKMLQSICEQPVGFFKVSAAYDKALAYYKEKRQQLNEVFVHESKNVSDISVVFLGRPYTILSGDMNSKIPDIFSRLGIKTFYQDMLNLKDGDHRNIAPLLDLIHWHYASQIFEATEIIANTQGLYPVLITSFKCTPDAFVIETIKKILDSRKKPYLILQLDEHDSSVGYETRIEAGIRAFRNHHHSRQTTIPESYQFRNPEFLMGMSKLKGKTLILPNFDYLPCKLLEASLRKAGIETFLMTETESSIRRSMSLNGGQCLPISMMTQAAIDCIEKNNLNPENTAIWTIDSNISCNLGIIPHSIKNILNDFGKGMEKVEIYTGEITFVDLSLRITYNAYFSFMFGGLLKKMGCKTRPYETIQGETDQVIEQALEIFYDTFLNDKSKEEAAEKVVSLFEQIKIKKEPRPQVAIFGDLYARDNDVVNQNLIQTIEKNGGEAITTPYSEYMRMIANPFIRKWIREGLYSSAAIAKVLSKTFPRLEKRFYDIFNRIINEKPHCFPEDTEKILNKFGVKTFHSGESLETLLKIYTFINNYPAIALFVQTNPSLCCPSLVTEAMADNIEKWTGIPVVSIEYDGTGGLKNDTIVPYLKYPRQRVTRERKKA